MSIINRIPRSTSTASATASVLLLHCDGSDASTTFLDESAGGSTHTMTANNNAQVDTAFKQFGTGSFIGDVTNDTMISTPNSSDFFPGVGDYTIDCWVRRNTYDTVGFGICGTLEGSPLNASGFGFAIAKSNNLPFFYVGSGGGGSQVTVTTTTVLINVWTHLAFVVSGGMGSIAVNGVFSGTPGAATFVDNALPFVIGEIYSANSNDAWMMGGHIDEFRVSKGIARWTTNFTPPIAPYTE
jgi:hypothetical protein